MILVSACLLGENCKYSGGNNRNEAVLSFLRGKDYVTVCPELLGGLPCPRPPAEIVGGKVMNREGEDVTAAFRRGAEKALLLAKKHRVECCILKANSPSCGCAMIYDGTFCGKRIPGMGLTARLLADHGYKIFSEEDIEALAGENCGQG